MKNLANILLLLLAVLIPNTALGEMPLSHHSDKGQIEPGNNTGIPATSPLNRANLFAVHHQPEEAVNHTNRVPQPSLADTDFESGRNSANEIAIRQYLAIYLKFSKLIDPGFSIYQLIYPYHFFL